MELKAIVLMIIKIVISIPTIVMLSTTRAHGATLMGGHIDNRGDSSSLNRTNFILEEIDQSALKESFTRKKDLADPSKDDPESIPDPSPLVVPGYNLPDNIFNKGKPFYLEKNPVTGELNFPVDAQNSPDDEYLEYEDEDQPPSTNIFDKSNIDRKDGHIGSHKPNDVNQLTPNFHDFLNLPVKYNSDKYVYPLISSSYANTKVQGNINRYHNHKDYTVTTYKPTKAPTYMPTKYSYFDQKTTTTTSPKYTQRTTTSTTRKPTTEIYLTTTLDGNLMQSPMVHHSFEDSYTSTDKTKVDDIFLTTTPPSETKRPLSLFEQIFGSYDEMEPTTKKPEKVDDYDINGHAGPYNPNVLTGSNMGHYEYEYEDGVTDNIAVENQQPTRVYTKPSAQTTTTQVLASQPTTTQASTTAQASRTEAPTTIKPSTTTPRATTRQTTTEHPTTTTTRPTTTRTTPRPTTTTPRPTTTTPRPTTTTTKPPRRQEHPRPTTYSPKVTSMPLGEFYNNQPSNQQQIIVSTQHLRDQLNNEKVVPRPFERPQNLPANLAPSSSNIIVPADQNTVSFVVGNQQNVGNDYVGFKESPFDNKPFRPLFSEEDFAQNANPQIKYPQEQYPKDQYSQDQYSQEKYPQNKYQQDTYGQDSASYQVGTSINLNKDSKPFNIGASSIMHPIRNSETSLAIGVPVEMVKKPGQVVDDPEIQNAQIEFPKGNGPKIVFPVDEKTEQQTIQEVYRPEPPPTTTPQNLRLKYNMNQMNKEILKLSSKPMLHQLPSDLTPPSETVTRIHQQGFINRDRPPWDPRPGHFHSGRPEYARPPRPNEVYKRVDNLPNILPQFRPNAKPPHYYEHHPNKGYLRQPLLERPSNRPIGFFEKLQPPPLPKQQHQMNHNLRKGPPPQFEQQAQHFQQQNKIQQEVKPRHPIAEDRIMNEGYKKPSTTPEYAFYQTPPKVVLAQRRNGDSDVAEVETLQMLQAKKDKPKDDEEEEEDEDDDLTEIETTQHLQEKDKNNKPIFVVYPVNSGPMKLDVLDSNKKETVVIGKRAELPLPPSQIQDFDQDSSKPFDFNLHERHDSPILKPQHKPSYPSKTDFPYPLERPDPSLLTAQDVPNTIDNNPKFESNSWDSLDDTQSRIVTDTQGQISVKLKTYTEKPIAVAYTPTEPHRTPDKYSLPNYASPVIPEIRNPEDGSEITVGAVMNTHQTDDKLYNHAVKTDDGDARLPQLDFQAPFQASVNVDNMSNNGWSVVRERNRQGDDLETTTQPLITTNKFDIENFNPPLIGGFKPIYNFPDDDAAKTETEIKERQE